MSNIIVPGQMVADKPVKMGYAYVENGKTYSTVLSLQTDDGKLIPLCGPYEPLAGDAIVGFVSEVKFSGFSVNIRLSANAYLSSRDSRDKFELGDMLTATIRLVDEVKSIELEDAKILRGGTLVPISPAKIPRVIGKKNSMINLITEKTGCEVYAGRNGYAWVSSERGNSELAIMTLKKIEQEAHIPGLTNRVADFLASGGKR
jgi:exosome complex component RRP4